jgi:sugar phosphate isomerase/epimerase
MHKLVLAPTTLADTPPLEYVEAGAAAGYDAIGLRLQRSPAMPYHPVLGDAPLIRAIKARLAEARLAVLDIFSCYLQPTTDIEAFAPALELGGELGARYVLVMGDDPDAARLRDNFVRFCALAGRFGLCAAIEFAPTRPLATLGQSVALIAETGVPNAVICLDPLNLLRGGGGAASLRGLDARLFPYAQITDGVLGPGEPDPARLGQLGPAERRMLGDGVVPLGAILAALPPGLPLSVELPAPPGVTMSARDWAAHALAETRRYLAGIGQA